MGFQCFKKDEVEMVVVIVEKVSVVVEARLPLIPSEQCVFEALSSSQYSL